MVPFQAAAGGGHACTQCCPIRKAGDSVGHGIHDFEATNLFGKKRGHNFALNATLATSKPEELRRTGDPGGRAPEYLRLNPKGARYRAPLLHCQQTGRGNLPRCDSCLACGRCTQGTSLLGLSGVQSRGRTGRRQVRRNRHRCRSYGRLIGHGARLARTIRPWINQFLKVLGTRIEL